MSTTGLDAATLARSLRRKAGDGSVEWVMEPIQSSVLRDIADMLDENKKLRELLRAAYRCTNAGPNCLECRIVAGGCTLLSAMRELGIEVPE